MDVFTQIVSLLIIYLVRYSVQSDIQAQYFVKNEKTDIMYKSSSIEKIEGKDIFSCMKTCSDRNCLVVLYNHVQRICFICNSPVKDSEGTPRLGMTRWDVTMTTGRKVLQDVAPEHMGGRVLVAPRISGKIPFVRIDVHSNKARSFHSPNVNQIYTIAYDSVEERLLIGLNVKRKLVSCNLTDASTVDIKKGVVPKSLSIDAKKRLVFFTSQWPGQIKRIDLNSKYKSAKRIVSTNRKKYYTTAVYPKEEMLLFSSADTIFSTNYDGKKMTKLVLRVVTKCLSVDPYGGFLFFSNKQHLKKIKITEPEKQISIWKLNVHFDTNDEDYDEFNTYIHDIIFDGNYIYITHALPSTVTQINLKNKKSENIVLRQFDNNRLLLSIVP